MPGSTVGISENYGYPGSFSRNNYPEIRSRIVDPSAPFPVSFSDAIFRYGNVTIQGGVYSTARNLSASFTATSHSSNVIDGISSLTNPNLAFGNLGTLLNGSAPLVGMLVLGPGLSVGTTITAIGSNSLTLSAVTSSSVTSTFTITSPWLTSNSFAGVALREVKTSFPYNNNAGLFGSYAPGTFVDVLKKGSVSVLAPTTSPIAPWDPVYLQIAVDPAATYLGVGTYQSQADGLYTIALPNVQWGEGLVDSNGVAEIDILVANNA